MSNYSSKLKFDEAIKDVHAALYEYSKASGGSGFDSLGVEMPSEVRVIQNKISELNKSDKISPHDTGVREKEQKLRDEIVHKLTTNEKVHEYVRYSVLEEIVERFRKKEQYVFDNFEKIIKEVQKQNKSSFEGVTDDDIFCYILDKSKASIPMVCFCCGKNIESSELNYSCDCGAKGQDKTYYLNSIDSLNASYLGLKRTYNDAVNATGKVFSSLYSEFEGGKYSFASAWSSLRQRFPYCENGKWFALGNSNKLSEISELANTLLERKNKFDKEEEKKREQERKKAEDVEALIDKIGKITLKSKATLDEIESAYKKLSVAVRLRVYNYEVFEDAKKRYAYLRDQEALRTLRARKRRKVIAIFAAIIAVIIGISTPIYINSENNKKSVAAVEATIDALTQNFNSITLSEIENAENEYNALKKRLKSRVSNYYKIEDAKVQFVILLISDIGTVSLANVDKINYASLMYNDYLSENLKQRVTNYNTILAAKKTINVLIAIDLINNIGEVEYDSDGEIYEAATWCLENLSVSDIERVTNYDVLIRAQMLLPVRKVEREIDNIGAVTASSGNKIMNAELSYENLSQEQKNEVKNYAKLIAVRETFEVKLTIKMIDDLFDSSSISEATIEAAQIQYNSLSDEQKAKITNYTKLENALVEMFSILVGSKIELTQYGDDWAITDADKTLTGTIQIPDTYQGKKITLIAASAFQNCVSLTKVILNSHIQTIGNYAFQSCGSLKEFVMFDSVTYLGEAVFNNCTSLESIELSQNIEQINYMTFTSCNVLKSVTLPENLLTIGSYAFSGCHALEQITIPKSVTSIEKNAFSTCKSLKLINFNAVSAENLIASSNVFENVGIDSDGTIVVFGEDVEAVPSYLFRPMYSQYAPNIVKVEFLGDKVTSIGMHAFDDITTLKDITLPDSVTSIGEYAFSCTGIESLALPKGLTHIPEGMFFYNSALKSITIGEKITSIGKSAFNNCINLTEVFFNATSVSDFLAVNSVFYQAGQNGEGIKVVFGENVKKLPSFLFSSNGIEYAPNIVEVEFLGDKLTLIGESAFRYLGTLNSISIPKSVTSIGQYAFANTTIESLVLPEGLTEIPYSVISNNTALKSVTIPESVTSIGSSAFYYCTGLEEVYFNAAKAGNLASSNNLFYKAGTNGDGISVAFGENVEKIPNYLFYPSFGFEPNVTSVEFLGKKVLSIGSYAFAYSTFLEAIEIPSSVTSIGPSAFTGCVNLTQIEFNAVNMDDLGVSNFVFFDAGKNSENGLVVLIGEDVTKIPAYLFYASTHTSVPNITTVVFLGEKCTSIGERAFANGDKLKNILIPHSVTTIEEGAFLNCEGLTRIDIHAGVNKLGANAFGNCRNLDIYVTFDEYGYQNGDNTLPVTELSAGWNSGVGNTYYYGGWQPNQNKLHFDGNGATSGDMESLDVGESFMCRLPSNTFKRDDFVFVGWSRLKDSGMELLEVDYADSAYYVMGSNTNYTLYAVWRHSSYRFNLDENGGELPYGTVISQVVLYGSNYTLPTPSRVGYSFLGWFVEGSNVQITNENGQSLGVWNLEKENNVVALWQARSFEVEVDAQYIVTFDMNGKSGTVPGPQIVSGSNGLAYVEAISSGNIFSGWYNNPACNGDPYDFTADIYSDLTLYAKWSTPTSYTGIISAGGNSGSVVLASSEKYFAFVPLVSETILIYTVRTGGDPYLILRNSSKVSIAENDDGNGNYNALITYNVTAGTLYYIGIRRAGSSSGSATIYINGTMLPQSGGTALKKINVDYDSEFEIEPLERHGYDFLGWYYFNGGQEVQLTDELGVGLAPWNILGGVRASPKWQIKRFVISLDTLDGNEPTTYDVEYGASYSLGQPSRRGYTFQGWYELVDGEVVFYTSGLGQSYENWNLTEDKTLLAMWSLDSYTITYVNADTAINDNPTSYTVLDEIEFAPPILIGHTGVWDTLGILLGSTGDITVTASYTINKYAVVFDPDGGKMPFDEPNELEIQYLQTVQFAVPTRYGFEFLGWYILGGGESGEDICITDKAGVGIEEGWQYLSDCTLSAKWEVLRLTVTMVDLDAEYVVSFDLNGGEGETPQDQIVDKDTFLVLPQAPSKAGYKFVGWFENAAGAGEAYANTKITKNTTFYARWALDEHSLMLVGEMKDVTVRFVTPNQNFPVVAFVSPYDQEVTISFNNNNVGFFVETFYQEIKGNTRTTVKGNQTMTVTAGTVYYIYYDSLNQGNCSLTITGTIQLGDQPTGGVAEIVFETLEIEFDSLYTLPVMEKEDVEFVGWFSEPNGYGFQYTDHMGRCFSEFSDMTDITLYAYFV